MLTKKQVLDFEEFGFLVLPDMAKPSSRKEMISQASELVQSMKAEWFESVFSTQNQEESSNTYFLESGDKIRVFMEEGEAEGVDGQHRVNKLGHAMHDLDPVFSAFSHQKVWADIAADIGMASPGLLQSMYIFKQPRIGGEVNIHQDATFLYTDPISVVGFWFAMQDATLDNGCLWALPGGHRMGLKSRFIREEMQTRFEVLDDKPLPETGYVPLEVEAGTLILLHGLLPHYSEANRSDQPRQAYTLHVIDQAARYLPDNWLQRDKAMPLRGFVS